MLGLFGSILLLIPPILLFRELRLLLNGFLFMLETLSSLLFLFPNPPSLGFALDGGGGGGALLPPDPKLGLFCEGGGGGGAAATWFDEGPFV